MGRMSLVIGFAVIGYAVFFSRGRPQRAAPTAVIGYASLGYAVIEKVICCVVEIFDQKNIGGSQFISVLIEQ
jgi:hypothetical protein